VELGKSIYSSWVIECKIAFSVSSFRGKNFQESGFRIRFIKTHDIITTTKNAL